jgi:hypothetical protein
VAEYALHRHLRGELFLLTLGVLSAITLATTAVGRLLIGHTDILFIEDTDIDELLFIMPFVIIGQVALAVWWLRKEARAMGAAEES